MDIILKCFPRAQPQAFRAAEKQPNAKRIMNKFSRWEVIGDLEDGQRKLWKASSQLYLPFQPHLCLAGIKALATHGASCTQPQICTCIETRPEKNTMASVDAMDDYCSQFGVTRHHPSVQPRSSGMLM